MEEKFKGSLFSFVGMSIFIAIIIFAGLIVFLYSSIQSLPIYLGITLIFVELVFLFLFFSVRTSLNFYEDSIQIVFPMYNKVSIPYKEIDSVKDASKALGITIKGPTSYLMSGIHIKIKKSGVPILVGSRPFGKKWPEIIKILEQKIGKKIK